MADLQVNILSPAKVIARTEAKEVLVPGVLGYMGILPGHAALISELGVGELALENTGSGRQVYFVAGGYVDVTHDQVTVLVDVIEKVGDIDIGRAEKAKQRALQRLEHKTADIDLVRAQASLARAQQRLATATRTRQH